MALENSMPAYGAAVAMGAEEIEFDLWPTKDDQIISCHDLNLERLTGEKGFVLDMTLEELNQYDFGVKFGEKFKGMKILTLEDILKKFSCQTIMNIHIKTYGFDADYDRKHLQAMIDKAHAKGIRCDVFWADDPDEAQQFIEMGVDTILTNEYQLVAQRIKSL